MEEEFNYKYALERLKYENSVFWQRTTAFLIGNSLLVVAFSSIKESVSQIAIGWMGIVLALTYLYACTCSYVANSYWQKKIKEEETDLKIKGIIKTKMYTEWERHFSNKFWRFYPGGVMGFLLIVGFIIVWGTLLSNI